VIDAAAAAAANPALASTLDNTDAFWSENEEDHCEGEYAAEATGPPHVGRQSNVALRIDGEWYDCAGWARAHPGGGHFVRLLHGRDATDVFYALHSNGANGDDTATRRLKALPRCDAPDGALTLDDIDPKTAAACRSFGELRAKLEADGWFRRDPLKEAAALANVLGLCLAGSVVAWTGGPTIVAALLVGFGMQQAGWLGHDYIHGRGRLCDSLRGFATWINGHSAEWWTQKHSMHHSFTNEHGKDQDITMEPVLWVAPPGETGAVDSSVRKWQHWYGYPLMSITFWLWRMDSVSSILARRDWAEALGVALNLVWLASLGPVVAVGAITWAGLLVGSIVTATHQSEPLDYEQGEFVDVQFRSTRDADVGTWPLGKWLWGGMDVQLEHHLFPTMPRYNYHKLRPLIQEWAAAQNGAIEYKISPAMTILRDNWETLRAGALGPAVPAHP